MAIVLPRKSSAPDNQDPRVLVLIAQTKVGKSSSCLQLPNSLLIDLEDGSGFYEGTAINLKQEAATSGDGIGSLLLQTATAIRNANQSEGKLIYDFITIDTLSVIEDIAKVKATLDYKATLQGKNFNGKDVTRELPKGAGWAYYNKAFDDLIVPFKGLAGKCLILLGHQKYSTIDKEDKEIQVTDLEVTGKAKTHILANADAIGLLRRNKKNVYQNIISFKTSELDLVCGSRSPNLRNKEFVFSTYDPKTNTLKCNWDLVFTSLQSKSTSDMEEFVDSDTLPNFSNGNSSKVPV